MALTCSKRLGKTPGITGSDSGNSNTRTDTGSYTGFRYLLRDSRVAVLFSGRGSVLKWSSAGPVTRQTPHRKLVGQAR
ncbi:hypothetical protein CEP52_015190 [Fusarium oligoseptatum]|uniref:Uncharacterized protein n=1 Tax=Fusarium oligoseptatum TaxID=2604345 RepID=A0A428SFE4_9HYPO|nr:hypothetical protein CEP52_015190 [Fusarium oligoseptatum]